MATPGDGRQWMTFFVGVGFALALVAIVLAIVFWRFPVTLGDDDGKRVNVFFPESPFTISRPKNTLEPVPSDPERVSFAYEFLMENLRNEPLTVIGMGGLPLKINERIYLGPWGGALYEGNATDPASRSEPLSLPLTLAPHEPQTYTAVVEYELHTKVNGYRFGGTEYDAEQTLYDELRQSLSGSDTAPLGPLSDDIFGNGFDLILCYTTGETDRFHSASWDHDDIKWRDIGMPFDVGEFVGFGC